MGQVQQSLWHMKHNAQHPVHTRHVLQQRQSCTPVAHHTLPDTLPSTLGCQAHVTLIMFVVRGHQIICLRNSIEVQLRLVQIKQEGR